jgi:hypothetical protein
MASLENEYEKLTPEQKEVIKKLFGLALKEGQVEEKIQEQFKKGFKYEPFGDGLAISVLEDEDDFRVRNAFKETNDQDPLYRERIKIKEDIKSTLGEAVSLNLGYLGIIQRSCSKYNVKMK